MKTELWCADSSRVSRLSSQYWLKSNGTGTPVPPYLGGLGLMSGPIAPRTAGDSGRHK